MKIQRCVSRYIVYADASQQRLLQRMCFRYNGLLGKATGPPATSAVHQLLTPIYGWSDDTPVSPFTATLAIPLSFLLTIVRCQILLNTPFLHS